MKKQQGMVLFFSLIVLIVMTIIGVALAVNSSQSLRMAGAGGDRISALSKAQGGLNIVINDSVAHSFSTRTVDDDDDVAEMDGTQNIKLMPADNPGIDVNCQRTEKANAANLISCRRLEISSSATFGRAGVGQLTVTTGIEQEVLTGS
ncbi:pilus assembly PilX N-terminal domain-containing protein [Shewanella sp. 5_MG-2023]|uniref:pilus assembly PilX family protein n=1 Tax=Shewanella sp. 5_MG-2023 TaxID=3062656 RepID=UPI0026E12FE1|nr:pilus assembly PilX N-terminal domain-containing protein [Shewanella sp. 5_MG-2023]MDO6638725.1 pilus assembly PilX N-terminal domain-containing protein [Shewanella sp. 5_MG-2023]